MANGITYGISFPFVDSFTGRYLDVTNSTEGEVRSSLVHLILTRKGSRYFLPDFGTRLYEFIFEPLDGPTFSDIESEIPKYCTTAPLLHILVGYATNEKALGAVSDRIVRDRCILNL